MRRAALILAAALAVAATNEARAEYEPSICRNVFDEQSKYHKFEVALAALERCQRAYMGIVPIEHRAARGEKVLRAIVMRGERSIPLFVEYVFPKSGGPWLDVGSLATGKRRIETRISDVAFEAVWSRWAEQMEIIAADEADYDKQTARDEKQGVETVCVDAGVGATIETAENGNFHRAELGACRQLQYQAVDFLLERALKDSGECATLAHDSDAGADGRLLECIARKP